MQYEEVWKHWSCANDFPLLKRMGGGRFLLLQTDLRGKREGDLPVQITDESRAV